MSTATLRVEEQRQVDVHQLRKEEKKRTWEHAPRHRLLRAPRTAGYGGLCGTPSS